MFASGGHGGNLIVIGVPSMRILKYVGVFTPEPWQGYGFDEATQSVLKGGQRQPPLLIVAKESQKLGKEASARAPRQLIEGRTLG